MIKKLSEQLQNVGQSQLASLLTGASVISNNGSLILGVNGAQAADVLSHRSQVILNALAALGEDVKVIEFQIAIPELEPVKVDNNTYSGTYHNEYNSIVRPDKHERATIYFVKNWRPLLKPLCSELVRELRRRCYKDNNDAGNDRDNFKATYSSLASALGVGEATIKRALKRDSKGNFVNNPLLGNFIKSMENILKTDEKGNIRSFGTRFVIYLDEPYAPKDQNDPSVEQIDPSTN